MQKLSNFLTSLIGGAEFNSSRGLCTLNIYEYYNSHSRYLIKETDLLFGSGTVQLEITHDKNGHGSSSEFYYFKLISDQSTIDEWIDDYYNTNKKNRNEIFLEYYMYYKRNEKITNFLEI